MQATRLRAERIGYLVARQVEREGCVHSSFRHACNVSYGAMLLTLAIDDAGAGPTRLELAHDTPRDLRALFRTGEAVRPHTEGLQTDRVVVSWLEAPLWRPATAPMAAAPAAIDARLALAERRLLETAVDWRDGTGELPHAVAEACRHNDRTRAVAIARRMLGRGAGLTPACDDFLAGLLAGLELAGSAGQRRAMRAALAQAICADLVRTTTIAAHALRLAAQGHHGERLLALRDALVTSIDATRVAPALDAVLRLGATSGAALAAGLLAGIDACVRGEIATAAA